MRYICFFENDFAIISFDNLVEGWVVGAHGCNFRYKSFIECLKSIGELN